MATSNVNLSVDEYVRINTGLNPLLLQSHRDTVRIVFSQLQPALTNKAFHQLGDDDHALDIPYLDVNAWALAMTDTSSLTVTEFPESAIDPTARTAFGEMKVESMSPITQVTAHYALLNNVLTVTDNEDTGTNSLVDNKFTCDTGISPTGLASITTLRQIAYRAGQGLAARFTALFDNGTANNTQIAGMITAENSLTFGYVGETFGILHAHDGMDELQELTITTPAAGAETATVVVNGIGYSVILSGGGIVADAYEVAASLLQQVPNYNFSANGATVVAQAVLPLPQGVFTYISATSAGTWEQIEAGLEAEQDFIPQTEWNRNVMPGLIPQFGNVFQVQFQYLGFGDILFFIKQAGEFVLVHIIEYTNRNTKPNVSNPTFRIGWLSVNQGNTTNVRIQGSSAGGFIEGKIFHDNSPLADSHNQETIPSSVLTNVMSFRNRISFGNKVNRAEIFPRLINGSSQTGKVAFFKIIENPIYATEIDFEYVDKNNSITEISKDNVVVTGGREVGAMTIEAGAPDKLIFNDSEENVTAIYPGSTLCIAVEISAGAPADCQASATWQEDL
tara:strand:- start:379 stop:2067 length:1689 start_codon:yes stop_codon:yes gene_type:complete